MSETSAAPDAATSPPTANSTAEQRKELFFRLLFMLAYWFLGNIAFSLAILLGFVQFVVLLVSGEQNQELKRFNRNLVQYIWHCLAYVSFMREDKPFPLGPFPSVADNDDAEREPKPETVITTPVTHEDTQA